MPAATSGWVVAPYEAGVGVTRFGFKQIRAFFAGMSAERSARCSRRFVMSVYSVP